MESTAAVVDNSQYAAFGHGTMVMGMIHLVAPQAQLLPQKAFSSDGSGYLSNILHAVYYGVQNGANVINMSFDMKSNSTEFSKAITYANQNSVICAASAGNDGVQEIVYPAAYQSDVMGVASTSNADMRSCFSNYGDGIVWVAAPGEGIVSTYPFGTYAAGWGTSFSAPFVSGAGEPRSHDKRIEGCRGRGSRRTTRRRHGHWPPGPSASLAVRLSGGREHGGLLCFHEPQRKHG
jgi:subtilisin family serine protease